MNRIARNWRVLAGGLAAGSIGVLGLVGNTASADPSAPEPPVPAPVTVTVTVTPQAAGAPSAAAASPAAPAATPAAQPLGAAATPSAAAAPLATTPQPLATPTTPPLPPATSGTLAEFFKEKGVALEPQKAADFTALNITLPVPTGWTVVPDPNVPDAFSVIANRKGGDALYTPNAQLTVYKLVGEFDPREAISHGFVDAQQLPVWQPTAATMTELGGFPTSQISGTYRETDLTLNTTRRHIIATAGPDRYLVSLSVTTAANQVVAAADATEAILQRFKVAVPGSQPAAAPEVAAPVVDAAGPVPAVPAAPVPGVPAAPVPALPAVPAAPAPAAPAAPAPAPALAAPAAPAVPALPAAPVLPTVPVQ